MFLRKIFPCCFKSEPTPTPTPAQSVPGSKKAFLVGINKYVAMQGSDLNGCVNDVQGMWERLTDKCGFEPDDIQMVCDERATQDAILSGLKDLVENAKPGDLLVFHYSGHGTSVRIGGESEECQCLCPTDMDWDDLLTDKMMATEFKKIPMGAFLTFICDACHSGSMDRNLLQSNPHPPKIKYVAPPVDIAIRSRRRKLNLNRIGWRGLEGPRGANVTFIEQRHMLMSGCRDDQTSADAYVDGKYQGAMTASLMKALEAIPNGSWLQVHENMLAWLATNGYSQVPQLSGPKVRLEYGAFKE